MATMKFMKGVFVGYGLAWFIVGASMVNYTIILLSLLSFVASIGINYYENRRVKI